MAASHLTASPNVKPPVEQARIWEMAFNSYTLGYCNRQCRISRICTKFSHYSHVNFGNPEQVKPLKTTLFDICWDLSKQ